MYRAPIGRLDGSRGVPLPSLRAESCRMNGIPGIPASTERTVMGDLTLAEISLSEPSYRARRL
jgi:hypothetical protein